MAQKETTLCQLSYSVLPKKNVKSKKINIHAFIFNWPKQTKNALRLETELKKHANKVTVINSDDTFSKLGWVDLGDDAYFTEQFCKAVEMFDGDLMFHIQADASTTKMKELLDAAKKYYLKYDYSVYAPNINYTCHDDRVVIENIKFTKDPNLKFVMTTDCTCWFICKKTINEFKKVFKDLYSANTKHGWGAIRAMSSLSLSQKRLVLRDYNFTIKHPKGTNYSKEKSWEEYKNFVKDIFEKIKVKNYITSFTPYHFDNKFVVVKALFTRNKTLNFKKH